MSRGRGGSARCGGSRWGRNSGRCRVNYVGIVQHSTSSKDKSKSGLSKSLGNDIFTYKEKNSGYKMRIT